MRTPLVWITGLAIVGAVFLGCAYLHGRALQRSSMYGARTFLEQAYTEFERTGTLPASKPHAQLSVFTNTLVVGGVTQQCALALDWFYFRRDGFLAMTTNRTVLWIDKRSAPRIIDGSYR